MKPLGVLKPLENTKTVSLWAPICVKLSITYLYLNISKISGMQIGFKVD